MEDHNEKTRLHESIKEPVIKPDSIIYIYDDVVYLECEVKTYKDENIDVSPKTHFALCTLGLNGKLDFKETVIINRTPNPHLPGLHRIIQSGKSMRHDQYFRNFEYAE